MGSHDVIAVLFATLRLGLVMPFICSNLPFRGELQRTPTSGLLQGRSPQLDRADRRDLSIFRLGLESIEQALTGGEAFVVDFLPVFDLSLVPFFRLKQLSGS